MVALECIANAGANVRESTEKDLSVFLTSFVLHNFSLVEFNNLIM